MYSKHGINRASPGTNDQDFWMLNRLDKQDGRRRGVLYAHQGGTLAVSVLDPVNKPGTCSLLRSLADAGYAVAGSDISGQSPMGNATSQARLAQVDAWTIAAKDAIPEGVGAASSKKRIGLGISQGATTLVNYFGYDANDSSHSGHVADLAAFVFVLPALNLDFYYQNNTSGLRAVIEAAWGVTYPAALPARADSQSNMSLLASATIPIRIYIAAADSDPIQTTSMANANLASLGGNGTVISLGDGVVVGGHTEAVIDAIDKADLINWLSSVASV